MSEQQRHERVAYHEPTGSASALSDEALDGRALDEEIDEASAASFPASDPPAWVGMRIGGPHPTPRPRTDDRPVMREPDKR